MSRDSILDEAEQKQQTSDDDTEAEDNTETETEGDQEENAGGERERLTQRVPPDLLEDVEAVEEKFRLGSRNATINFMLSRAADDLLDRE